MAVTRHPLNPAARPLARDLLDALRINERQWHALKSSRRHRAAEQVAAGLNQLLHHQDQAAMASLQTALNWLRGDLQDPGCPDRHRKQAPVSRPDNEP
ncbi:MAG: DUF6439 family protein [Cyanobacteria bacterium MAG CAR4_bin_6]|nr:DUF6439 family protein [Cyanobacteria bacterium MAG CAR4_bin_6]MCY4235363.1 DUF6439 family protein [Cyanobacteria bacterium MAG CAR2_bin_4]